MKSNYKKYNLLLDNNDPEERELIKYLEKKHTNKHKGSFSSILRTALKMLADSDKDKNT